MTKNTLVRRNRGTILAEIDWNLFTVTFHPRRDEERGVEHAGLTDLLKAIDDLDKSYVETYDAFWAK